MQCRKHPAGTPAEAVPLLLVAWALGATRRDMLGLMGGLGSSHCPAWMVDCLHALCTHTYTRIYTYTHTRIEWSWHTAKEDGRTR